MGLAQWPAGPVVHILVKYKEEEVALGAVISALANSHRRRAVEYLALQPTTIQQLAVQLGVSLTAVDRHLTVLEDAGLIQRRKRGRVKLPSRAPSSPSTASGVTEQLPRVLGIRRRHPRELHRRVRRPLIDPRHRRRGSHVSKFLFLYKGYTTPTPEIGDAWMRWFDAHGPRMIDSGTPHDERRRCDTRCVRDDPTGT
jgi:DNA-binding transcriptional ArsR family regulator